MGVSIPSDRGARYKFVHGKSSGTYLELLVWLVRMPVFFRRLVSKIGILLVEIGDTAASSGSGDRFSFLGRIVHGIRCSLVDERMLQLRWLVLCVLYIFRLLLVVVLVMRVC